MALSPSRLFRSIIIAALVFFSPVVAHAEKMSIAVLPFECAVEDGKPYAKQLEATVEAILIDMKRFTIVERANLLALLDEQKLSMSGLIDQELTGGIVGGVQYLVVGRIKTISQEKTYNQATNRTAAHVSYNASASLFFKILN